MRLLNQNAFLECLFQMQREVMSFEVSLRLSGLSMQEQPFYIVQNQRIQDDCKILNCLLLIPAEVYEHDRRCYQH